MNKSGIAEAVISQPTGGGAISGIGETFSPDLHTGTGNLTVPLATPPGRNGFGPGLSLVYSTGQGNGPFGLGWQLAIPGITRDTRTGVPTYIDDDDAFLLSGMERLVPMGPTPGGAMRYRPRTEGSFARIERRVSDRDDYWEVRTRSGLVSRYGTPGMRGADAATVRDPDNANLVFAWNLAETVDLFGNRIEYEYERDTIRDDGPHRWDQVRLKAIRYADYGPRDAPQFLVTVDFVYSQRPDPFSAYRAGFEVRTTQRCSRIEVRTHGETSQLTRVYQLTYQDELATTSVVTNGASLLARLDVIGVDGEARESLPPLTFGYTPFQPAEREYRPMSAVAGAMPERSLAHPDFELADLFGRGLPDVVQIGDQRRYWKNLGDGRFDVPRPFDGLPPAVRLGSPNTQLADLDGDGQIDLLVVSSELAGYMPLSPDGPGEQRAFVPYASAPPFAVDDPELRLIDLDGDGVTDALRTGASLEMYRHDRAHGWSSVDVRARESLDSFPDVYFSDPRVKLADMTGDGLTDIVFVDGGRVDYWPSRGHGRWGRRVTMGGRLAFPDALAYGGLGFDPRRLLVGDVDGDGVADLVYVESGRVTIWLNQSGNRWSDPIVVRGTPPIADPDAVRLADMLGTGTAGILWTYDARTFADSTYKFLDLTGGTKPYLLCERDNHAGARTHIEYVPSTRYSLIDEPRLETRWRGRLPSPVQVVASVATIDVISGGKLASEYRYRQGAWDGVEREFRGFGVVEQLDTETFTTEASSVVRFSPPTLTRTWFHQGPLQDRSGAWFEAGVTDLGPPRGDVTAFALDQRVELGAIARKAAISGDPLRLRHALRALRGAVLRSELYALDDSTLRDRPYTVTEILHDVREIEPDDSSESGRDRVFNAFELARRDTRWERGTDPMTQFAFTGGYDLYGLPRTKAAVAVPRGRDPLAAIATATEPYLATYSVTEYAQRDDAVYLVDRIARTTQHEVTSDGTSSVFELRDAIEAGTVALRLIGHDRTYYDGEAFVGLPLGELGVFGAPVRREFLAFDDAYLAATFDANDPRALGPAPCYLTSATPVWAPEYPAGFKAALPQLAGYAHFADGAIPGSPGGYYVVAERRSYDFHGPGDVGRGLVRIARDALGADTTIEYDAFSLFAAKVSDAVGLVTEAIYDPRLLLPRLIVDPNGTQTDVAYSPLGMLSATYIRGAAGEGDRSNPSLRLEYDLLAFAERGSPMSVRSIRREHHDADADVPATDRDRTITSVQFSDGFGRLLQTRTQAEDMLFGDPTFGGAVLALDPLAPDTPAVGRIAPNPVAVSGWQTFDNKGRVVERYEPFFASGWDYRVPEGVELGEKVELFYDARGQLIRSRNPDGSEQLVILGVPPDLADPSTYAPTPWETFTYDTNDNGGRTHEAAATAFASHWNTPASIVVDSLGRIVGATARNGPDAATDWYTTRTAYDIHGNVLAITDALGREAFRYVYDLAKRRWRVDSIDAGRTDTVLDALANPVEVRDGKGARAFSAYDSLHRLVKIWARDHEATTTMLRHVIEFGDGGSATQPAADRVAAREANLLGRLARQHDEAGVLTVHSCDFKGNVIDKSRRVIADAPIVAGFTNAAATGWNIPMFRVDWEQGAGATLGDVEAGLLDSTTYRTSASFDALGRTKQLQLPADVQGQRRALRSTYNRGGALEQLSLDDTAYVERITYDARGQRTMVAFGNGLVTRYAYDPKTFRLARRRTERFTSSDRATYAFVGVVVQDSTYRYDLAGNLLAATELAPGSGIANNSDAAGADAHLAQLLASGDALLRQFAYDPIYRLTSATGRECDRPQATPAWLDVPRCTDLTRTRGYSEQYQYDAAGNLLQLAHRSATDGFARGFAVESSSNRLQAMQIGQTSVAYAYDGSGNVLSETSSRVFDWNHANQLAVFRTQVTGAEPSVYARYLYGGSGQRVKKLVRHQGGAVEVTHYIDGVFEHRRWGPTSANNALHVADGTQRVAIVRVGPAEPGDTTPAVQYQLADQIGSSAAVVNDTGALINGEEFTPYGETSFGSFAKKRYRFTGMERDEESSLSYHGARYYAPWLVRWSSTDPIGAQGGLNQYGYAHQNPILSSDTSGLDPDVNAFNHQIDKNGDNLITTQELDTGLECSSSTMTRESWLDQMAFDHRYRVDAALGREIDARLTSIDTKAWDERRSIAEKAEASSLRGTHDYGIGPGGPTLSTVANEEAARELLHPSARIWRDEKVTIDASLSFFFPVPMGAAHLAHGIYTGDDQEATNGLNNLFFGWALKNLSRSSPRVETTSPTETPSPKDYRATFFAAHPELQGQVIVHHAIEQQVLTKFPGVVSEAAIHALENLRGIPIAINNELHLSFIRVEWNRFYEPFIETGTKPTLPQLVKKATEIDLKYGRQFMPPVGAK